MWVWAPQYKKDSDLLESVQRMAMQMMKGVEGKMYEEQLKSRGLFCLQQRRLREDLIVASDFHPRGSRGAGADLCSLGTATGPEETAWSCDRGGSGWVLGKDSSPRGWSGTGTGSPRHGHATESAGVQEAFGQHSQT